MVEPNFCNHFLRKLWALCIRKNLYISNAKTEPPLIDQGDNCALEEYDLIL